MCSLCPKYGHKRWCAGFAPNMGTSVSFWLGSKYGHRAFSHPNEGVRAWDKRSAGGPKWGLLLFSERVLYFITLRSSFLFNIFYQISICGFFNISNIYKTTGFRRPSDNSQQPLSTLAWPAHPHLAERTLYAHIWSQARTKRLCPYLGRSQHTGPCPRTCAMVPVDDDDDDDDDGGRKRRQVSL